MMKLALIRRQFSATGGAERYLQRLIEALVEGGHEVHLFAETWPQEGGACVLHSIEATGPRSLRPRRFAEAVRAAVQPGEFDVVFSLERTLRQDVYRAGDGVHATWLDQRRKFASWWKKPWVGWGGFHRTMLQLERRTFDASNTRHIIVNSRMVGVDLAARFGFPDERIHLVRNGVRTALLRAGKRAETRRALGVSETERCLLFAGSGWERKGLKFLLRAFAAWDRADKRLIVAGKGNPPCPAPDRVLFTGPVASLADLCAAADLFVFLPIYEPSANVVIEALAAGLPVVTTSSNGASELLEGGVFGEVIEDPSDTGAVVEVLRRWGDRARLAPAQVDSLKLDLERNVEETLAVLHLAAQERRGCPR